MNTKKTTQKTVALTAALAIILMATAAVAARSLTCTVEKIEDSQVVLTCKKTSGLTLGQKVKVRPKMTKKIEGC